MKYNLPKTIKTETDLKYYENYLTDEKIEITNKQSLEEFLQNAIGNFARIETNGTNKMGVITLIGKDFLILRRQNNNTLIPFNSIRSITLPQGNQTHRHPQVFPQ